MSNTHRLNRNSYLSLSDNSLNYFEITGRDESVVVDTSETFSDWKDLTIDIEGFSVIPFGRLNDIPNQIQSAVLPNSFAHRLLKRKAELLIEQGPYIYKQKIDGREYFREPIVNEAILEWLKIIAHEELLISNAIDYYFQEAVYNKIYREKGGRVGPSTPATIEHVSAFSCRLAFKKTDKNKKPTHVIVGDWNKQYKKELKVYPLYDPLKPDKYPVAIHYKKLGTYGVEDYPLPDLYGSLNWIINTTNTPKIFKSFTENSLNIKWHIQSPAKFWEDKRTIIKDNLKISDPSLEYTEKMLEDLKCEILDKLSLLLSGVDNVGKFWHNEYVIELVGGNAVEHGWKIIPIEQKTKEWIEGQIKMYNTAIYAMQAGLGLHASLAMVGADGKSNSGGEQYYAYAIHQKTATPIPEYYVCKSINDIMDVKFGTKEKIGFYRTKPEHMQDITNSQRMIPTAIQE